jgi:hypothetical protein
MQAFFRRGHLLRYYTVCGLATHIDSPAPEEYSHHLNINTTLITHLFRQSLTEILNKRIIWQIENHIKDFKCVKLNSKKLQLIVFTNSFFANNRDMFSQIDYVICFVESDFHLKANVIHWWSIKCKRIIHNVLAAKLYVMTHDCNLDAILKKIVLSILNILISLILCIDSKSLYDCLVQLDTTQKTFYNRCYEFATIIQTLRNYES